MVYLRNVIFILSTIWYVPFINYRLWHGTDNYVCLNIYILIDQELIANKIKVKLDTFL